MPIYTKTGDTGKTSLLFGKRLGKDEKIFEVLGSLDEFNSVLGIILSEVTFSLEAKKFLIKIQNDLFDIGARIANVESKNDEYSWLKGRTATIEELIDELDSKLPKLTNFILPGGSSFAAKIHFARAVCRRLERSIVRYKNKDLEHVLSFINRLSDLLFVLARYLNSSENVSEVIWTNQHV